MAKKTNATTKAEKPTTVKKTVAKKKEELVKKIFLDKKSSKLLVWGEYSKSQIEKTPDLFFDTIQDAQQQAIHYLDEIGGDLKREEYTELFYTIKNFS